MCFTFSSYCCRKDRDSISTGNMRNCGWLIPSMIGAPTQSWSARANKRAYPITCHAKSLKHSFITTYYSYSDRGISMKQDLLVRLALTCALVFVLHVSPAFANVPTVTSVVAWTRQVDNHTILNITIVHTGYYPGHYVNWIKVNVSGTVHTLTMTDSSPVDQTHSSTFVVSYDMGVVTGTPTVQVQANCIIHGPSTWSPVITVPELSSLQLCIVLVVLTILVLLSKLYAVRKSK